MSISPCFSAIRPFGDMFFRLYVFRSYVLSVLSGCVLFRRLRRSGVWLMVSKAFKKSTKIATVRKMEQFWLKSAAAWRTSGSRGAVVLLRWRGGLMHGKISFFPHFGGWAEKWYGSVRSVSVTWFSCFQLWENDGLFSSGGKRRVLVREIIKGS